MTEIYLIISLSTHNGDDTPQIYVGHQYNISRKTVQSEPL